MIVAIVMVMGVGLVRRLMIFVVLVVLMGMTIVGFRRRAWSGVVIRMILDP